MFNKIIFYILFLLINSSLEVYYASELPQYDTVTVTESKAFYLSLDNFKSKDTLYFELSFDKNYKDNSISLGFLENNYHFFSYYYDFNLISSKSYSIEGNTYTLYFTYTLKGNKKYLLILTPDLGNKYIQFTLKHAKEYAKEKKGDIVGGIICIVVDVILFIALNIILCRCKRKNEELVPYTNVNNSTYTSQPVFTQPQPLYDQSQTPAY